MRENLKAQSQTILKPRKTVCNTSKPYRDYADYLAERFQTKMQKLTVNAGFTCPNRDGTVGTGGCTYCNNQSFSPSIGDATLSVTEQLNRGKEFFARKYPTMRYLAYFQSYTNTHGSITHLLNLYNEALAVEDIDGLIIGTRPDCINKELLKSLAEINQRKRVIIEYGAESANDATLRLINRCHSWQCTVDSVAMTREFGLDVGLHFILGLPGETAEMMMHTVDQINVVKPDTVKFHQLQIIRGTRLAEQISRNEVTVKLFTIDEYLDLCAEIVRRIDPSIAIERFTSSSPDTLLISPRWGLKNYEFTNLLRNKLTLHK